MGKEKDAESVVLLLIRGAHGRQLRPIVRTRFDGDKVHRPPVRVLVAQRVPVAALAVRASLTEGGGPSESDQRKTGSGRAFA